MPGDVTRLLADMRNGKQEASSELIELVYDELRRLASYYVRQERHDHTLQATALVNEAYLRMAGGREIKWEDRAHFFGAASQVMRRILVDYARTRRAAKRGGPQQQVPLDDGLMITEQQSIEVLALDEALEKLKAEGGERKVKVIELMHFGGLTVAEAAEVLGVAEKTVKRDWASARAWLYGQLSASGEGSGDGSATPGTD